MSAFSADWLHLREPFDRQAREAAFDAFARAAPLVRWRAQAGSAPLAVVDLACGTGSNLRALAPRLGGPQRWRLVDHDPLLLAAAPQALADWARRHGWRHRLRASGAGDLGGIEIAAPGFHADATLAPCDLSRELHRLDLSAAPLVTGSALLDLVSASWLEALVRQAQAAGAALLFALTVDGRSTWTPADADDAAVHRLFTAHQSRDKGFGPALGAAAAALAPRLMREAGYTVTQAPSDWVIDAQAAQADVAADPAAMLGAMIDGTAAAALEQARGGPGAPAGSHGSAVPATDAAFIERWRARRRAQQGATRLRVGHLDLCATPALRP